MSEWQPIETAPKDGTAFLGYNRDWGVPWKVVLWSNDKGNWVDAYLWWHTVFTHWMSLPSPPEVTP